MEVKNQNWYPFVFSISPSQSVGIGFFFFLDISEKISQPSTPNYSVNSKIRRKISFDYNAFSEKNALFRIALYSNFQFEFLCEEFFWEKFDYNASPYFRVKTVVLYVLVSILYNSNLLTLFLKHFNFSYNHQPQPSS